MKKRIKEYVAVNYKGFCIAAAGAMTGLSLAIAVGQTILKYFPESRW